MYMTYTVEFQYHTGAIVLRFADGRNSVFEISSLPAADVAAKEYIEGKAKAALAEFADSDAAAIAKEAELDALKAGLVTLDADVNGKTFEIVDGKAKEVIPKAEIPVEGVIP